MPTCPSLDATGNILASAERAGARSRSKHLYQLTDSLLTMNSSYRQRLVHVRFQDLWTSAVAEKGHRWAEPNPILWSRRGFYAVGDHSVWLARLARSLQ